MTDLQLRGKVAVITGSAGGIGVATARRLASEGVHVAGWDLRPADPQTDGLALTVDVTRSDSVAAAVEATLARFGRIDILINNAGLLRDGQLVKYKEGAVAGFMSDEQFDSLIDVNLRGVFLCTRAVVPHMIASGGGVILNAASVVGLYGNFGQTNYVASKAGVIGMTRVWAREFGRYKIRVNAVAPGFIATEMTAGMPEKVLAQMREHTPLGRLGEAEDIANAYVWLASPQASFITGTVLSVDGGVVVGT